MLVEARPNPPAVREWLLHLQLLFSVFASLNYLSSFLQLRWDALMLNLLWILPWYSHKIVPRDPVWAWKLAAYLIPVSLGWAAG